MLALCLVGKESCIKQKRFPKKRFLASLESTLSYILLLPADAIAPYYHRLICQCEQMHGLVDLCEHVMAGLAPGGAIDFRAFLNSQSAWTRFIFEF